MSDKKYSDKWVDILSGLIAAENALNGPGVYLCAENATILIVYEKIHSILCLLFTCIIRNCVLFSNKRATVDYEIGTVRWHSSGKLSLCRVCRKIYQGELSTGK